MVKKSMVGFVLIIAVVARTAAQDAKTVIGNASKASGYDGLKSIEYSGPTGFEGTAMGQARSATKGWPHFTLKNFSRYIDLDAGTGQQNSLRSRPAEPDGQLAGGGGLAPQPEAPNTTTTNGKGNWAQELYIDLSPSGRLNVAATASKPTGSQRNNNGKKYTTVADAVEQKVQSGQAYTMTGYIDEQNL